MQIIQLALFIGAAALFSGCNDTDFRFAQNMSTESQQGGTHPSSTIPSSTREQGQRESKPASQNQGTSFSQISQAAELDQHMVAQTESEDSHRGHDFPTQGTLPLPSLPPEGESNHACANSHVIVRELSNQADFATITSGYYRLIKDIHLSGTFTPVQPTSMVFLDGNGHQITGLKVNLPTQDEVGLFKNQLICASNLRLVGAQVTGRDSVGILVGVASHGGTGFSNIHYSGEVKGRTKVGGLIGVLTGSESLKGIHADVEVTAQGDYVGGIVGSFQGGGASIQDSTAKGKVKGKNWVGGFSGEQLGGGASILRSKVLGIEIFGQSRVGGFAGELRGGGAHMTSVDASGMVSGTQLVGGLAGWMSGGASFLSQASSQATLNGGSGRIGGGGSHLMD